MKPYNLPFISTFSIFLLFIVGCQKYVDQYYAEYFVDAGVFENYEGNSKSKNNIIDADKYKIEITLRSSNPYATEFGLVPKQINRIVDLDIFTLYPLKNFAKEGELINDFFLVENGKNSGRLYEKIPDFLSNSDGFFDELDSGKLVFTNQTNLNLDHQKIILKNDTVPMALYIKIIFDNSLILSDTLHLSLISKR